MTKSNIETQEANKAPVIGNLHKDDTNTNPANSLNPDLTHTNEETPEPKDNLDDEETQFELLNKKQKTAKIKRMTESRKTILDLIDNHLQKIGPDHYEPGILELLKHYPQGIKLSLLREVFGEQAALIKARRNLMQAPAKIKEEQQGQTTIISLV